MTDRERRFWLGGAAVTVAAVAAWAMTPPEAVQTGGAGGVRAFALLGTAALVGVGVVPTLSARSATTRRFWAVAAVAALAAGVAAWVAAGSARRTCTARYDGRAAVVGTQLTELGATYVRDNPGLSGDELLFDAAGVPERVWTSDSIGRCRTVLSTTYFLWVPFLMLSLLACVQVAPAGLIPVAVGRGPVSASGRSLPLLYDVFISYRHGGHDADVARDLLSALEARGYRVAIDERDFPANASFLQEMERCIRQSRFTVAVVSARYLDSGHCEEEAVLCKVLDMGDRRRRLIPLLIEPVALPAWLFGIVGVDCTKPDPLVDPFERLQATLGAPLSAGVSPA